MSPFRMSRPSPMAMPIHSIRLVQNRPVPPSSVSDIVAEAGVARGTFYQYFPGKRAVFDSILDRFSADLLAVVKTVDVSPTAPPPLVQLTANMQRVLHLLLHNRDMTMILLRRAPGVDDEADAKIDQFHERILVYVRRSLVKGMEVGLVRPCVPDVVAPFILGGIRELACRLAAAEPGEPKDVEELAREIVTTAAAGLIET